MKRISLKKMGDIDNNILKQLKAEYESCPTAVRYIAKLGIPETDIDDNIIKIHDFVSDVKYCKNCPGLEKCNKTNPHLTTKIISVALIS